MRFEWVLFALRSYTQAVDSPISILDTEVDTGGNLTLEPVRGFGHGPIVGHRIPESTGSAGVNVASKDGLEAGRLVTEAQDIYSLPAFASRQGNTLLVEWNITVVDKVEIRGLPLGSYEAGKGIMRKMVGVNGQWPIPPIHVFKGERLKLVVHNKLSNSPTSIHFHGLFQNGTVHYDGTYGITQCGIPPDKRFVYDFEIMQEGTYWLHGHYGGQYVDGLAAPLILHPRKKPTTHSFEHIVTLSDHYDTPHGVLLEKYLSIFNPLGGEPIPSAPLINHKLNASFLIQSNTVYKFRFVSMTAFSMYHVWFDPWVTTKIVEVDGVAVEPYIVTSFPIGAAQRVAVLVSTERQARFYAQMDTAMYDGPPPAINRVYGDLVLDELLQLVPPNLEMEKPSSDYDEMRLVPIFPMAPINVTNPSNVHRLDADFKLMEDGVNHGAFNDIVFKYPAVPTLFSATWLPFSSRSDPAMYGAASNAIVAQWMQGVEIILNNVDANSHPFHMHGHVFQIIKIGLGEYVPEPLTEPMNPPRRDTVIVPSGGYAVLRFVANNPGVWFFHCHIEWHLQAGLALTIVSSPDRISRPPQAALDLCAMQGIATEGNADGNTDGLLPRASLLALWPIDMTTRGWWSVFICALSVVAGFWSIVWFSS